VNGSHWFMFTLGLIAGAAIPVLVRWSAMPLAIAVLLVVAAGALVVLARRAGAR